MIKVSLFPTIFETFRPLPQGEAAINEVTKNFNRFPKGQVASCRTVSVKMPRKMATSSLTFKIKN